MKKRTIILGSVAVLLGAIAIALFWPSTDEVENQFKALREKPVEQRDIKEDVLDSIEWEDLGEGKRGIKGELTFEQIVAMLRKKYGDRLGSHRVRISMIEELVRYLKEKYPNDWVARLQEILGVAFPDLATELFDLSENVYKYQREMEARRDDLAAAESAQRFDDLMAMREKFFGPAAQEIWAAEIKAVSVSKALKGLGSENIPITDKVEAYKSALEQAYGKELPSMLNNRRVEFTASFLNAVQSDLKALPPAERRATYRAIWNGMGFDPAAVQRMDQLEDERDQRWSNGDLYEAERKRLSASYSGAELEAQLHPLRTKFFGLEGETIRDEESSGFFRFEQERRYGRN